MNHHSSADLLIVGAGPAGMAAARRAVRGGLSVIVLDSQSQHGGQIWRNAGRNATSPIINILGRNIDAASGKSKHFWPVAPTTSRMLR